MGTWRASLVACSWHLASLAGLIDSASNGERREGEWAGDV